MSFSLRKNVLLLLVFMTSSVQAQSSHSRIFNPNLAPERQVKMLKADEVNTSQVRRFSIQPGWDVLSQASAVADSTIFSAAKIGQYKLQNLKAMSTENHFVKSSPLVLVNQRTKNVGILTGTFEIKLKSKDANINQILEQHKLMLIHAFPHLQRYFVTSRHEVFNLENTFHTLSSDQRISSVAVEILDRTYDKK